MLLFAPYFVRQFGVGVVNAHTPPKVSLRVFDLFQFVHTQVQNSLPYLPQPQLCGNHGNLGSIAPNCGTWLAKDVRFVIGSATQIVRCWQSHSRFFYSLLMLFTNSYYRRFFRFFGGLFVRWFPFNLLYFRFCRHMKHSNDCLAQFTYLFVVGLLNFLRFTSHTLNDILLHRSLG